VVAAPFSNDNSLFPTGGAASQRAAREKGCAEQQGGVCRMGDWE